MRYYKYSRIYSERGKNLDVIIPLYILMRFDTSDEKHKDLTEYLLDDVKNLIASQKDECKSSILSVLRKYSYIVLPKTIPFNTINDILAYAYKCKDNCQTNYARKSVIRDIAVLEMLFATGARVSEICSITSNAIDLNEHTLKIFGKGSKERIIQIENPDVLKALKTYSNEFSAEITSSNFFFINKLHNRLSEQSVRAMINRYAVAAGYNRHITPHMFRHSFATLLLEEDVDIRYIQKILGHSTITTTQIYTHVALAKQKQILSIKHPRNKMKV